MADWEKLPHGQSKIRVTHGPDSAATRSTKTARERAQPDRAASR
ncbi:hypothetical protein [Streptomyces sp. 3N207]